MKGPKRLRVNVTAEHIRQSRDLELVSLEDWECSCPLALAVKDATGGRVASVARTHVYLGPGAACVKLSRRARAFVDLADSTGQPNPNLKPFSFYLSVPA